MNDQYFVDLTFERMPMDSDYTNDVDLIDIDGDGDLDIFFTNSARYTPYDGQQSRIYINDGTAHFTDETDPRLPSEHFDTRRSAFADFDADGDLDIIITAASGYSNRLWLNNGDGFFVDESMSRLPPILGGVFSAEPGVGDLDGDGDFDIMLPEFQVELPCPHINSSNTFKLAIFTDESGHRPLIEPSRVPALQQCIIECRHRAHSDHSEENRLHAYYCPSRLLINDGDGFFSDETEKRLPDRSDDGDRTTGFIFFDIDFDGDLDVFEAHSHSSLGNRLLVNDGFGFFSDESEGRIPLDNFKSHVGRPGDYDGDDNLDIILCIANARKNPLLMNHGGYFIEETVGRLPASADSAYSSDTADIDDDGWPDLIMANSYTTIPLQNRLLLNDGKGFFYDVTRVRLPRLLDQTTRIKFGDLDGDGDVDVVSANKEEQNRLYINRGTSDTHPPRIFGSREIKGLISTKGPFLISTHVIDYVSMNIGELRVSLLYSTDGGYNFNEVLMVWKGGRLYSGEIPSQEAGTEVCYYFKAIDTAGNIGFDPVDPSRNPVHHGMYRFTVQPLLALTGLEH
ncbi:MAG: FG-GAP repeat domain-containing protein [Candidatus Glassbacteria bacterium]